MSQEFLLVDLSSICYPVWHTSQSDPDPNATSIKAVARVRSLAAAHPRAAICADSGRSFRYDVDPTYKANRPTSDATLQHQIALVRETLIADGFPVWSVKGFEADDLIASAAAKALEIEGATVLIASADKDLLALVDARTRVKSTNTGDILDEAAVVAKMGVMPCQMTDYLTLVGDASDNIKGAKGIGPKRAVELLGAFGELRVAYAAIDHGTAKFQPATLAALQELRPRLQTVQKLVTMRTDVELPFHELLADRVPQAATFSVPLVEEAEENEEVEEMEEKQMSIDSAAEALAETTFQKVAEAPSAPATATPTEAPKVAPVPSTAVAIRKPDVAIALAPAEWERQLEPRSMAQALALAENLFQSRLFAAYGTAQAVLATVLAGRELGMQAVAALRAFHVIDGRPTLAADLIRAIVIKSGKAKYFRCTERTNERATFETQRGDDPPISLSYTVAEARTAWTKAADKFADSGWGRNPADMCVARAGAKLARLVYPDVVHGFYASEEIDARD